MLLDDSVDGDPVLLIVETNAHQLVRIPVPAEALSVDKGASQTQRPRTKVRSGQHRITVRFAAPSGQKLDDRWGDPTQLKISASPEELLLEGAGTSVGLERTLSLNRTCPRGSCTSPPVPPPVTGSRVGKFQITPPATCTSRIGASRCCWMPKGTSSWSWTCAG